MGPTRSICHEFCPGGGYVRLAIGEDGGAETQHLRNNGVTVFVLKYRMVEWMRCNGWLPESDEGGR